MENFVPTYYKKFKCIADKCKHSCCIGWEIDIDKNSIEKYKNIKSDFGKRVIENIDFSDEQSPHFKLSNDERCPFLDKLGLCEIIKNEGEQALCQICADHPRFRNFFDDFTETGLGLCCEAAALIILGETEKFTIENTDNPGITLADFMSETDVNAHFLKKRQTAFDIVCDRSVKISKRLERLLSANDVDFKRIEFNKSTEFLLTLEILDNTWKRYVTACLEESSEKCENDNSDEYEIVLEQFCAYLIFRHTATEQALYFQDDRDFAESIGFCVGLTELFASFLNCKTSPDGKKGLLKAIEIARMMSSEIEYSEENTESLRQWFAL